MVVRGTYQDVFLCEGDMQLVYDQEAGSIVRLFFFAIDAGDREMHINVECNQIGTGCKTEIYTLAYLGGKSKCEFAAHINHKVGGGESKQISRFVLKDNAIGFYDGQVILASNAQRVDALQNNRNLLLSDNAQMRIRPTLEIYADDVKASHGTSTGQLNEEAILYMRQRGISREQAEKMLVEAFMAECITPLGDEAKEEDILRMIRS